MSTRLQAVPLIILFLSLLLLPAGDAAARDLTGKVTVEIEAGAYEIASRGETHEILMDGFGAHLVPGCPDLPARIVNIAIPPGTAVTEVTFRAPGSSVLPGTYRIAPVGQPRVIGEENPEIFEREKARTEENYRRTYGLGVSYPASIGEYVGPAGYRKYNIGAVRVFPFTYDTATGSLTYHPTVQVTVRYAGPEEPPAGTVLVDALKRTEELAGRIIANYEEAQAWYPKAPSRGMYDYVIITLESLVDDVQPLVDWEMGKGRTVNVVTVEWIADNYTGYDLAEKMRNFLREKYPSGEWGIEDVCLVGHYDDVPMRRCWQDTGYGKPETDLYYAELSLPDDESWDADGDHRWGEDSDPIDFISEVNVGRIPWSTPSTVQHICEKSVAYENNPDPAFKKNILLLAAFFWPDTDNAVLMEYKTDPALHPWMEDWTMTRLYEEGHTTYPCDADITNANVRSTWSNGTYAFVDWAGHGSPDACWIYYSSGYFISNNDCPILNDDYPAIIFADACSNSDTDYLNIGQAMLQQGGVGFLGATKVAYGMGAWDDPMDGSSQSLDYFFTTCCTSGDYTQGQAHQWSLYQMYSYGLWYYNKYEMFEWGALWGNPDLSMGYYPAVMLLFPDGLPSGEVPPGQENSITIEVRDGQETYVPGSGRLHYRLSPDDPYTEVEFTPEGDNIFTVVLPTVLPGHQPEFYFSAEGDGGTVVTSPIDAPEVVYSFDVCLVEEIVHDDFETDLGWTVEDVDLLSGSWERCVPNATSGGQYSPLEDNPAGEGSYCFATENGPPGGYYRDYDVDGGPTMAISPVFDLSRGDGEVSCYLWHANDDSDDPMTVEVSNDDGVSWTVVEQLINTSGWERCEFTVSEYVTPSDRVRVRFSAVDNPNNSITEAGIDDFTIVHYDYEPSIWADAYTLSASEGGIVTFTLDAGAAYAGRDYIVGGSMSGVYPGTRLPGGGTIPLNFDQLSRLILDHLNGTVFQNFSGTLDGEGSATATLSVPGPISPDHVGKCLAFAFTLSDGFDFASNPVLIVIEP